MASTKYRLHEVARDFNMASKDITAVLTDYAEVPKNVQQVMTARELNVIFDCLTQKNSVASLEKYFTPVYVAPAPVPAPAPAPAPAAPAKTDKGGASRPQSRSEKFEQKQQAANRAKQQPKPQGGAKPAPENRPANPAPQAPAQPRREQPLLQKQEKPDKPFVKRPERVTKLVDTRGGVVNMARFDERIDSLVPDHARKMGQGKEKIKNKGKQQPVISSKRRQEEQERMNRLRLETRKKQQLTVTIPDEISVSELALRLKKTGAEVVKRLMRNGVMASLAQTIDYDTAALIAMDFGAKPEREIVVTIEERLIDSRTDEERDLKPRDPVVVVMGHVDHGKTSLLDYIRSANVTAGEFGGITQHIGAYRVESGSGFVTFLDTPGHAAFTSMRRRGASVTDIAILVVAADDGIMPQTIEAINHAKAAGVPIVVAANKIDKPAANVERVKQELTEYELVAEEWGGDTIIVPVSAKTGEGIDKLLEMVQLTADMRELKANPDRAAQGAVIEAKLDKGRGPVATVLVQNGTLKQGDVIIAGTAVGRVRAMTDDKGNKIETAGPSVPVEIIGLADVPDAGDTVYAVDDERMARELVEQRRDEAKQPAAGPLKPSLETLYAQLKEGEVKELNIIVKADVQGSAEAVRASLEKIVSEEVRVKVIHSAVGAINESDVLLAATTGAIIVGFNVRPDPAVRSSAESQGVDLRTYRVIYECIEEIEAAMKGMLAPKFVENTLGRAEVRQVFKVTGVGTIAGSYVQNGKVTRSAGVRLLRDSVVVYEGSIDSLKRFKDDAKEVAAGYECGIGLEKFNDVKEGDIIEAFIMEEVKDN